MWWVDEMNRWMLDIMKAAQEGVDEWKVDSQKVDVW